MAHAWLGWILSATGRLEEGISESSKAVDFEPRSPLAHTLMAANLYFAGEHVQSFESAGRALAIDSQFALAHYWRSLSITKHSVPAPAIPNAPPLVIAGIGRAHAARGQTAQARASLEALVTAAQSQHVSAILFAGLHAALRDQESALEWLERAYETRAKLLLWTRLDPVYKGLRAEPRFLALLEKMKL
jgi:tetratricopeptide (TPR) repeat protein